MTREPKFQTITLSEVRQEVEKISEILADAGDPKIAADRRVRLYSRVLRQIRDGEPLPRRLAAAALEVEGLVIE